MFYKNQIYSLLLITIVIIIRCFQPCIHIYIHRFSESEIDRNASLGYWIFRGRILVNSTSSHYQELDRSLSQQAIKIFLQKRKEISFDNFIIPVLIIMANGKEQKFQKWS